VTVRTAEELMQQLLTRRRRPILCGRAVVAHRIHERSGLRGRDRHRLCAADALADADAPTLRAP